MKVTCVPVTTIAALGTLDIPVSAETRSTGAPFFGWLLSPGIGAGTAGGPLQCEFLASGVAIYTCIVTGGPGGSGVNPFGAFPIPPTCDTIRLSNTSMTVTTQPFVYYWVFP